ncbi:hypothetical protein AVEN_149103-1 [Araneus ventricosus]|uniref:Uncharacterized protein n=1 Tax=Araneus ventricosus TaxID=182803 RepID=A0A4Y2X0K6_ARAVE|nr:hypothetical protein AVEN_149103-1 [Araneus ventricosus]
MPWRLRRMASRWPSDYFLSPKLKEHLSGTRFSPKSDVKTDAESWLNGQGRHFCQAGLNNLVTTACGLANLESLEVRICGLWSVNSDLSRGLANLESLEVRTCGLWSVNSDQSRGLANLSTALSERMHSRRLVTPLPLTCELFTVITWETTDALVLLPGENPEKGCLT